MPEKFTFREFSANGLVKSTKATDTMDEDIRNIVVEHLDNILHNTAQDTIEQNEIDTGAQASNNYSAILSDSMIDDIKNLAFNDGYEQACLKLNAAHELEIAQLKNHSAILSSISQKLSDIALIQHPTSDYVDLIAALLQEFTDKVMIVIPTNFEQVIKKQLANILESGYITGKIIIKLHQSNVAFVEKILGSAEITSKFSNIEVIPDLNMLESDCIMEYVDTKLVYDRSIMKKEIDEMIIQFKQDSQ